MGRRNFRGFRRHSSKEDSHWERGERSDEQLSGENLTHQYITEKNLGLPGTPAIFGRTEHGISRKGIDPDALKVMYRLIRHGFRAFLVGGGVRDLLLGKKPKDYDVGTDATTEQVRSLFRNSRIIGRRFRINHVFFYGNKIIEVSTFRRSSEDDTSVEPTLVKSDNVYGDPETDARRRDLTINGLFYDLSSFSVIDYVGGMEDLHNRVIRVIGEADARFTEDPVRMIRAIRHAARTGFEIEPITYESIKRCKDRVRLSAPARIHEEVVREFRGGASLRSFELMEGTGLLEYLFPFLAESLGVDRDIGWQRLRYTLGKFDEYAKREIELAESVCLASLLIDNVPREYFFDDNGNSIHEVLRSFLTTPDFEEEGNLTESNLHNESLMMPPVQSHVAQPKHDVLQVLRDVVVKALRPLSVSRRERDNTEQLLYLRGQMILGYLGDFPLKKIRVRGLHKEILQLLECTATQPALREMAVFWKGRLGEEPTRSGDRERGRRRGQRRRR